MDTITKEVMEQYELVRRSGATNMFDFGGVQNVARKLKFKQLLKLTRPEYVYILQNFNTLMKKYDIKQV